MRILQNDFSEEFGTNKMSLLPAFEYYMFKPTVAKRINTKDRSIYSLTLIFINSYFLIIVNR